MAKKWLSKDLVLALFTYCLKEMFAKTVTCVSLTNLGLLINNKSMSPEYPMKRKVNNQGIKYDITWHLYCWLALALCICNNHSEDCVLLGPKTEKKNKTSGRYITLVSPLMLRRVKNWDSSINTRDWRREGYPVTATRRTIRRVFIPQLLKCRFWCVARISIVTFLRTAISDSFVGQAACNMPRKVVKFIPWALMNFVKPSQRKTNSQVYCGYIPDSWRVMFLIYIYFFFIVNVWDLLMRILVMLSFMIPGWFARV